MTNEMDEHWQIYLRKLKECEDAARLTRFYVMKAARATEVAGIYALQTAECVNRYVESVRGTW